MVTPRILIVEDHRVFSEALELALGWCLRERTERTEFRRAATVAEGLRLLRGDGPFDVAIVDLMLPDGAGVEVLDEIRASHPRTRVAALGLGRGPSGTLEAGLDETIGKESPFAEMVSRLARLAGGGDRPAA